MKNYLWTSICQKPSNFHNQLTCIYLAGWFCGAGLRTLTLLGVLPGHNGRWSRHSSLIWPLLTKTSTEGLHTTRPTAIRLLWLLRERLMCSVKFTDKHFTVEVCVAKIYAVEIQHAKTYARSGILSSTVLNEIKYFLQFTEKGHIHTVSWNLLNCNVVTWL